MCWLSSRVAEVSWLLVLPWRKIFPLFFLIFFILVNIHFNFFHNWRKKKWMAYIMLLLHFSTDHLSRSGSLVGNKKLRGGTPKISFVKSFSTWMNKRSNNWLSKNIIKDIKQLHNNFNVENLFKEKDKGYGTSLRLIQMQGST